MSEQPTKRVIPPKRKRSKRSKILVAVSYVVSLMILVWSAWVPIQAVRSDSGDLTGGRMDIEQRFEIKRASADEIRRDAIALDEKFMDEVRANRVARTSNKPTSYESQRWLENRVRNVKRQIKELGNPKQGTIQWEYKQDLIKSLEDTPTM